MSEHTKGTATPWEVSSGMVQTVTGIPIAWMDREPGNGTLPVERDANAELIVLAVNAHAELVEALMWAMKHVSKHGTYTYEDNYRKAKAALRKAGAL